MSSDNEWRWAEADGTTHPSSEAELSKMLESSQLPPYVLVWRVGWGSWLPAQNVAELSRALGNKARLPMPPIKMRGLATPPRVPLSKYTAAGHPDGTPILSPAATKPRGKAARQGASTPPPPPSSRPPPPPERPAAPRPGAGAGRAPLPPPTPTPRAPATSGAPNRLPPPLPPPPGSGPSSIPPPPRGPIPIRDVMPTLADQEAVQDRNTLKPARAVAPPPRTPPRGELEPIEVSADSGAKPAPAPIASLGPQHLDLENTLQSADDASLSPDERAALQQKADLGAAPEARPADKTPEAAQPSASDTAPKTASAGATTNAAAKHSLPPTPAGAVRTATIVGLSIPVVALLTYLSRGQDTTESSEDRPAASVATETPAPSVGRPADSAGSPTASATPPTGSAEEASAAAEEAGCTVEQKARVLGDRAHLGVPPIAFDLGSGRVAVGYASDPNTAKGLTVELASGSVESPFSRQTRNPILGTVPGMAGGKLVFWVDVVGGALLGLRTVPADPAFAVGVQGQGFVRRDQNGVHPLWSGIDASGGLTTPSVSGSPEGYALAARVGGKGGEVLAGWLTPDGQARGDLQKIRSPDPEVGTPEVTVSDGEALVSFAARPTPDAPWRIRMATLDAEAAGAEAKVFELPPGGPGAPAISPATARLPGGRFLIVWTEGASGSRDVRAQVLDANLVKRGKPTTLSPAGANAGKGVPFTDGNRALVVFYVKTEDSQEIWGATLKCQ